MYMYMYIMNSNVHVLNSYVHVYLINSNVHIINSYVHVHIRTCTF